ncbi:uncharacterized protein LOC119677690 [Teleopsis dalmanni]|uniref:uncharacterized protein LOC119677690 n=1 Tax=Teleopsis dalmanni TaxID=139649 RepID=UPI000D32A013|nr:uncharacterized protein LOC119677690 [Teleopsis dalmanni]XP_037945070.1 uncharacterized protein LOC119677690 [Teleopsis dalmanni]
MDNCNNKKGDANFHLNPMNGFDNFDDDNHFNLNQIEGIFFIDEDVPHASYPDDSDDQYDDYETFLWESGSDSELEYTFVGTEEDHCRPIHTPCSSTQDQCVNRENSACKAHIQQKILEAAKDAKPQMHIEEEENDFYDSTQSVGRKVFVQIVKPKPKPRAFNTASCSRKNKTKVSKRAGYMSSSDNDDWSDSD